MPKITILLILLKIVFTADHQIIQKITDNKYDDFLPVISHNNILAWRFVNGEKAKIQIKFPDGKIEQIDADLNTADIKNLKSRAVNFGANVPSLAGLRPFPAGAKILFSFYDSSDYEIALYDNKKTSVLSDNNYRDDFPVLWKDLPVWCSYDGEDFELVCLKKNIIEKITENVYNDYHPACSGSRLIWQAWNENDKLWSLAEYIDNKIVMLDKSAYIGQMQGSFKKIWGKNLPYPPAKMNVIEPALGSGGLVFLWKDMSTYEAGYWPDNSAGAFYIKKSEVRNMYLSKSVQTAGGIVVFAAWDDSKEEYDIYYWKNNMPLAQKIDRKGHDAYPVTDGKHVYWQGFDGNDYEIYRIEIK